MMPIMFLIALLLPTIALADDRILGVWQSDKEDIRLDILGGFKPNRGAVLIIKDGVETDIGFWETKDAITTMRIGWRSEEVKFWAPNTFEWNNQGYQKQQEINEQGVVLLKQDKDGFVDRLTRNIWLTSTEGKRSQFKSTFSTDSGVSETFSSEGDLESLSSWGVSSGVLKIADDVIIEARVSQHYMIGLNDKDKFVVFQALEPASLYFRADLADQRSEFLQALVTDVWQQVYYDRHHYYRFRPVEGPLRGRRIYLNDKGLEGISTWEYSPSTGALKIGRTKYVGGLVIGDTLALLEDDGDQAFYKRKPGGAGKTFTVLDVKTHRINETHGSELANILSGQFQKDSYLYSFEFNDDLRTGFIHEWRSEPFTITGHELSTEFFRKAESVHEVEDLVLFDDRFALKRDATASRLKTKEEEEIIEDKAELEKRIAELGSTTLVLRITAVDGQAHDILLPFSSMSEVSEIQFMAQ